MGAVWNEHHADVRARRGVTPIARHVDPLRASQTGTRHWGESPHLETWDEYERTHAGNSPHLETREEFERTHHA